MSIATFIHDPDSNLDYSFDLAALTNGTGNSNWLQTGETVVTAVWTVPSPLTGANNSIINSGTTPKIWISGGVLGNTYVVSVRVTTSSSPARIQDFTLILKVRDSSSAFSYSGDPSNSNLDETRFLLGDTDFDNQLFSDSEVLYAIGRRGNPTAAAATLARTAAAKFAALVDKAVGDLRLSYSQRQRQFIDVAARLETYESTGGAVPYAGGIKRVDVESNRSDQSLVDSFFIRKQFDHPGTDSDSDDWDNTGID